MKHAAKDLERDTTTDWHRGFRTTKCTGLRAFALL
jgi:hypothetical protein